MSNIGSDEPAVLLLLAVAFGWGIRSVARGEGYSFWSFADLGAVFALVPLIVAALLPRRRVLASTLRKR